ncbi:MAG: cupredoxin domain-containing protein [Prosthecobacter sp.]|nr:cupredoxin domain-containing protein [Prosthecobacter sp.]
MKPLTLIMLASAAAMSFAAAEEKKTVGEKTKDALRKAGDATKDAGQAVVDGTKKAGKALVDAVTPDSDAKKVEVKLDSSGIDMPAKLEAGKTAFVVKNAGKEKHNFRVHGDGVDEKFLLDVKPDDSKVMHVNLKPGTYQITCPNHEDMKRTLTVE